MFGSIKYVTAPNIETERPIATGVEKGKEIPKTHFFLSKWCLKLLPVAGLATDFDFVHIVGYYNIYLHL